MKVYTSSIRSKKKLEARGYRTLDITVKSGDLTFSPTWNIVMGIKKGRISKEQYERQYRDLMQRSRENLPKYWDEILQLDHIVFLCYCPPSVDYCHRYILAKIFVELGAEYCGEIS